MARRTDKLVGGYLLHTSSHRESSSKISKEAVINGNRLIGLNSNPARYHNVCSEKPMGHPSLYLESEQP